MLSATRAAGLPARHSSTVSQHPYKSGRRGPPRTRPVPGPSPLSQQGPDAAANSSKASISMATKGTQVRKVGSKNLACWVWWAVTLGSLAMNLVAAGLLLPLYKGRLGGDRAQSCSASESVPSPKPREVVERGMQRVDEISVSATSGSRPSMGSIINLDHGDPTMYEAYWQTMGDKGTVTIPGWQRISYFSDPTNLCWFLEPELAIEIRRMHRLVGNAVTDDHHIIIGTGSTQLFQAALYALSPADTSEPMSVVSPIPYYSSYPAVTDYLKSGLFRWAGDANAFKGDTYIELVCSPNNPDGSLRQAVLNSKTGKVIHDLAYYWPQYTPITGPVDHEVMLFTVSKSTGHAGTRIGWALVKDREVARRMMKFIELNTIGVSKDSQIRVAKILKVVSDMYETPNPEDGLKLFEYGRHLMRDRWARLREVVDNSDLFSLPEFPTALCNFANEITTTYPAFAWLKCEREDIEDCESFLRSHKILTRSGKHFGVEPSYVRISMLDREETFNLFLERLSSIQ